MEIITSTENKKIKELAKLLQKKYRDIENKFIVEGEHLVKEALKSGYLVEIIRCEEYDKINFSKETIVSYDVIKKLSTTKTPQKIIGICTKKMTQLKGNKILLLDSIQDPGNLGTILRSACAFSIDTVILGEGTVDLYNEKVIRASEGMLFHLNICQGNLAGIINDLKTKNYHIYGTNVQNGHDVAKLNLPSKFAIIVGNEGAGVCQKLLNMCDENLYIPMQDNCESLNVAVATSIILYEINKKRN